MTEPKGYRLELEQILQVTGKRVLTASEVYRYTGKGRKWCSKHLTIGEAGISATELARQLSTL